MTLVRFEAVDATSKAAVGAMDEYFAELDRRFTDGFCRAMGSAESDAIAMSPPGGAFVVGRASDGAAADPRVVACCGLQSLGPKIGEIKRMWVDGSLRGHGVGKALLAHVEELAAGLGHEIIRLDTNDSLVEAVAMYRSLGYAEIADYNANPDATNWFEKRLDDDSGRDTP